MKQHFLIYTLLFIFQCNCIGQILLDVDTIEISTAVQSDSTPLYLTNIAINHRPGHILKNYGPGSIATISLRGTSASHATTYWNGMKIDHGMIGQFDHSLIPHYLIEDTESYDVQINAVRENAIGGVIHYKTENKTDLKNKQTLRLQLGSFGHYGAGAKTSIINKRLHFTSRIFYEQSDNNYSYSVEGQSDRPKLSNSAFQKLHSISDASFKVSQHGSISMGLWLGAMNREIPPTKVQTRSEAFQEDRFMRSKIEYQFLRNNFDRKQSFGFNRDYILFSDPINNLESPSIYSLLQSQSTLKKQWKSISGSLHQSIFYEQAEISNYANNKIRWKHYISGNLEFIHKQWTYFIKLENTWAQFMKPLLGGSARIAYQYTPSSKFALTLNKSNRVPTLNDLFWKPGGNPDLKAERALGLDLNARFFKGEKLRISLYNKYIQDWILWARLDNNFFWSPQNIEDVSTQGVEIQVNHQIKFNSRLQLFMSANYNLSSSKFLHSLETPVIQKGDQLWYIPLHTAGLQLSLASESTRFRLHSNYQSMTNGINENISEFTLVNIDLKHTFALSNIQYVLGFQANNLMDSSYEIVERRPMPGRNYLMTFDLIF